MKGYRFFLEFSSEKERRKATVKNPIKHTGNVLAIMTDEKPYIEKGAVMFHGIGAVYYYPNSPVGCTSVHSEYLKRCIRIPESMAREIHPQLFSQL